MKITHINFGGNISICGRNCSHLVATAHDVEMTLLANGCVEVVFKNGERGLISPAAWKTVELTPAAHQEALQAAQPVTPPPAPVEPIENPEAGFRPRGKKTVKN